MSTKLRAILYAIIVGALGVLVAFGVINGAQQDALLTATGALLNLVAAVAAVIAYKHVTEDSWSSIRAAVFATTSAALAAAGVFGLILPRALVMERTTAVLNLIGLIVRALAAGKVPIPDTPRATPEPTPTPDTDAGPAANSEGYLPDHLQP